MDRFAASCDEVIYFGHRYKRGTILLRYQDYQFKQTVY